MIDKLYRLYLEHLRVDTDTRTMKPGGIFFALQGPNFDGNQYAARAIEQGAAYAVVSDSALTGERYIHVHDTLAALQTLAATHRNALDIPVLGITGSNGKTTTKELIATVLRNHRASATVGNLNNHIGVPLTILRIPPDTQYAIIEMGANHPGEIAHLCTIARPTHGIVTNIGKAHLEGFGSLDGVKKAKSELYDALSKSNGTAFVNTDVAFLHELSAHVSNRLLYRFGSTPSFATDALSFSLQETSNGISVSFVDETGERQIASSRLFGTYNAQNIAAAIAVGLYFRIPSEEITEGIEAYEPANNRSQIIELNGLKVIMDAYNANPTSMAEALRSFAGIEGEKHVILGEMRELGAHTHTEHTRLLRFLNELPLQTVFLVGEAFAKLDIPAGYRYFADADALMTYLAQHPVRSGHLLIKGSRRVKLERLLAALK